MSAKKIWVRGVVGRLARVEPQGSYLPVDRWIPTSLTRFIQRKAENGDLEISFTEPKPEKQTDVTAKPAKPSVSKPEGE